MHTDKITNRHTQRPGTSRKTWLCNACNKIAHSAVKSPTTSQDKIAPMINSLAPGQRKKFPGLALCFTCKYCWAVHPDDPYTFLFVFDFQEKRTFTPLAL